MLKYRNQVKNIQGVGAAKTATIFLPTGPRYHEIILVTGDSGAGNGNAPTNAAIIGEIRIIIGGKVIRRMTAAQLDLINSAMGANFASVQAVTGGANGTGRRHIPIFFAEPWRKRSNDQDALALQTGWLGSKGQFQIECDLQAAITPVLTAVAITDNFDSGKPNGIMKWLANDLPAVGTPLEVATLDRADLWSQLSFFDTSDGKTIDRVRLVADGVELHDFSSVENTTFLKSIDMSPATGAYHVVFDHDDTLDDLLPAGASSAIQATLTRARRPTEPAVSLLNGSGFRPDPNGAGRLRAFERPAPAPKTNKLKKRL
jgi:hypothetical protein